jgi:DNA primase
MNASRTFIGFDALKNAVSIVQVLERYGLMQHLHRSGDNLNGACPLHHGHNKSQFRVSVSKNCWICFGDCHAGGSIVDFVSRRERVGIREAALLIQDWFGLKPYSDASQQQRRGSTTDRQAASQGDQLDHAQSNAPLPFALTKLDVTHPYLSQRRLDHATLRSFGVGYCSRGTLAGWIAIPIHNALGQLVAYAARWPGLPPEGQPKYRLPKGFKKSLELFNLHRTAAEDQRLPLVVVEGFFGCMAVWQAGHRRVVSLMGSMLSDEQEELIHKAVGPQGKVILMLDEDEAGRKGSAEARARLSRWLSVDTIRFESEGIQPDDLTADRLLELVRSV